MMMGFKIGDKVEYNGLTRNYLYGRIGTLKSGPALDGAWFVEFDGDREDMPRTAWVAGHALKAVESSVISEARSKVVERIQELEKEISKLRSEVSKLNAANKALKNME